MNAAEAQIATVIPDIFVDIDEPIAAQVAAGGNIIPEGQRDHALTSMAGSMRKRGFSPEAIAAALHVVNQQQCRPELPSQDVERIARSVSRYRAGSTPSTPAVTLDADLFQTAAAITLEQPPAPRWIIPGYVAPGVVTEFDGKLKAAGKTTFVSHGVRAILDGGLFLGRPTRRTSVVWLTEERPTSFQETLKRARLHDSPDLHVLYWHKVKGAPWPDVMNLAITKAKAVGAELVIVDTIGQFAGLKGDAENNSGDALAAVEPLQLAAAQDLAVGVVRHERKGGGEVGESGRGSSAFSAAVDIIVSIRRAEGTTKPNVRVLHALSRFTETPDSLVVELVSQNAAVPKVGVAAESISTYVALGTTGSVAVMEAEKAILDILQEGEEHAKTMAEICGDPPVIKRTVAQAALKKLTESEIIKITGTGKKGKPYCWFRAVKDSAATQITRCGSISDSPHAAGAA